MPWFRNHYVCIACDGHWLAESEEAAAADCPFCRAYDVAPYKSDDRSELDADATTLVHRLRRLTREAERRAEAPPRARKLRRAG